MRAAGQASASYGQRQAAETSEVSARGLVVILSFLFVHVGNDFRAAFLQLDDVAFAVKGYSSLQDSEQDPDPTASLRTVLESIVRGPRRDIACYATKE